RHPPEGVELVGDDLAQAELSRHVDLRRQQARPLDLALEQRLEPRAEAAGVDRLDILERQILLQPERHVEVTAGPQAHGDRYILQVLGLADLRIRPHENRPWRHAVAVADEPAHARAGVGDRAPHARALDQAAILVLSERLVLRPLEVLLALPARLRAAERLDVPLD